MIRNCYHLHAKGKKSQDLQSTTTLPLNRTGYHKGTDRHGHFMKVFYERRAVGSGTKLRRDKHKPGRYILNEVTQRFIKFHIRMGYHG